MPSLRCKKCDTKDKKLLSGTFDSEYFAQTIWNKKYYFTGRCMEALQHIWSHQVIHPHRDVMWAAFGDAVITLFLTSILLCIVVYLFACFLVYRFVYMYTCILVCNMWALLVEAVIALFLTSIFFFVFSSSCILVYLYTFFFNSWILVYLYANIQLTIQLYLYVIAKCDK